VIPDRPGPQCGGPQAPTGARSGGALSPVPSGTVGPNRTFFFKRVETVAFKPCKLLCDGFCPAGTKERQ